MRAARTDHRYRTAPGPRCSPSLPPTVAPGRWRARRTGRAGGRPRGPDRPAVGDAVAVHRLHRPRGARTPHRGRQPQPARWLAGVIRCRFDFDRQVAMRLAEQLGATPADTLARFRHVITSTTKPPLPVVAMLGEAIVHGEDIRRPLGIRRDYPITTLTRMAELLPGLRPRRPRQGTRHRPAARGHRRPFHRWLRATRVRHHPGPDHGHDRPRHYCDELDGEGVAILRNRSAPAQP